MRRVDRSQSGQLMVIVAVWLIALIGSAALVLLVGSVEWQRNQLQQLADQVALDAALKIGVGCNAASATTVITEADRFLATQRVRTGVLNIAAGPCVNSYTGTDTYAGGLSETVHYPYRAHQQQVEVILTLSLPISFGSYMGAPNTTVIRRAVSQQLTGSTAAVTATTLSCTGGQFNVAGSVAAQNAIALSGGCAVYAHARFDLASGTYSDLGNAAVYANGQPWVGGGGVCVPGASAGSRNAVCADGYELSGHTATTCGTKGTSAFLSAGDAVVNANPCAAGTGPRPVAPISTLLPPEPNTDPAAVATLPGGNRCNPAAAYPNLVVGGAIVGTAEVGTPAPVKDAAGFYHFKPSCYGYLTPPTGGGAAITRVRTGPVRAGVNTVTATLPAASMAGTLLVAMVRETPTNARATAPAGWVFAAGVNEPTVGRTEIWYRPNNPGGITTATFTLNPNPQSGVAQMTEWRGVATVAPLDQTGTRSIGIPTRNATIASSGLLAVANELVVTNVGFTLDDDETYTPGGGWTSLANQPQLGYASEFRLNLPAGIASETVTLTTATDWTLSMATFKPAGATLGAVLDPGFYYFNGSGFAGGGGICLRNNAMLARDVTIEFVNRAGFSSGTCAPGGGAGCAAGVCQFGSTPCSISACPPNAPVDPGAGGYTWFAAPCSQAPPGDASCPGSAWCPAGDRACWNLLVWAPASNTGQVAIKGTAARHWLLGSVYFPGTCTDAVNGTSTLDGTIACGTLSVSAAIGTGTAVGSDYGINTAVVESVLVE